MPETLIVPGTPDGVRASARAFDAFVDAHGLPATARWRFQVALDEMLSNAIKYGRAGSIRLTFALVDGVLSAAIADDGGAFDPLTIAAPDRSAALDARAPGGAGIALVRELMDAVTYERRDDHNHVTMIWRVRQEDDAASRGSTNDD